MNNVIRAMDCVIHALNGVIRAMDAFYEKHPTASFVIAILAVFAVMYIAKDWDREDTNALRLQLMLAASRGAV